MKLNTMKTRNIELSEETFETQPSHKKKLNALKTKTT